jgi:hypothetical protein
VPPRKKAAPTGQAASIQARLQRKGMSPAQAKAFARNAAKRSKGKGK